MNEPTQPTRRQIIRDAARLLILGGLSGVTGWLVSGGRVSFSADDAQAGPCQGCSARETCGAASRGEGVGAIEACPLGQRRKAENSPRE
ncbi:MAG: hypothetical protein ACYC35_09525 [Pirellulales bacterium]